MGILLFSSLISSCCFSEEIEGIEMGTTFYVHLSCSEHRQVSSLIKRTLQGEPDALDGLIHFDCGGGAGCYDLGGILTQIVHRIGEDQFLSMAKQIPKTSLRMLNGLLGAGLEYGPAEKNGYPSSPYLAEVYPELGAFLEAAKAHSD